MTGVNNKNGLPKNKTEQSSKKDSRDQQHLKPEKSDPEKMKSFVKYLLPVLIYAVIIFYLSVVPMGSAPPSEEPVAPPENVTPGEPSKHEPTKSILFLKYNIPYFNELANIFLYLIFGILSYHALRYYLPKLINASRNDIIKDLGLQLKIIMLVSCIALVYSTVIEINQISLISRVADAYDVLYDTVGAILGAVMFTAKDRIVKR
jgi:VanZ family protein